jgi:hypothetical protein
MRLALFVSHSFQDDHHLNKSLEGFRRAIKEVKEAIQARYKSQLEIDLYLEGSEFGQSLPSRIRKNIEDADVFLIDISGRTANTFFELGYAQAIGTETIIIQRKDVQAPIPVNISDLLVGFYSLPVELKEILIKRLDAIVSAKMAEGVAPIRSLRNRCFWFEPSVREIHIVCGPEPEATRFASLMSDDYLLVDSFDDRDALFELSTFLSRAYPNARLVRHTSATLPPDIYDSNLVLVGGPLNNRVTGEMMAELNVAISYIDSDEGIEFRGPHGTKVVRSQKNAAGILMADAGYFGRFRNPFARQNRIIMCQGGHTFGTLGASSILADNNQARDNIRLLERLAGVSAHAIERIECVFTTKILANRRVLPSVVAEELSIVHAS